MTKTLHGKVHGKTIELDEDPGVAEGQEVEVQMKVVPRPQPQAVHERGACQGVRDSWAGGTVRATRIPQNATTSISHEGRVSRYRGHDCRLG